MRKISANMDHPRIRGEHAVLGPAGYCLGGSSPHTRGARSAPWRTLTSTGIIPAYAGSTAPRRTGRFGRTDHPRIRGEHSSWSILASYGQGSSPHTRGALVFAYPTSIQDGDHPRIRGEHVEAYWYTSPCPGSSPHTRGAPHRLTSYRHSPGIIPAYAGSTVLPIGSAGSTRDHPRIRGEHRAGMQEAPRWAGIIPAYAGSTRG